MLLANFDRKEHLRHRAVSLRQHGFLVIGCNGKPAATENVPVCVDFYFYLFLKTVTVNILLHATVSAMDYTPNVVSKRCFFFIFKHSWAPKKSWKISHRGPGQSWKSPGFFPVKEWDPCHLTVTDDLLVHDCNEIAQ